jgi:hypothetical protein
MIDISKLDILMSSKDITLLSTAVAIRQLIITGELVLRNRTDLKSEVWIETSPVFMQGIFKPVENRYVNWAMCSRCNVIVKISSRSAPGGMSTGAIKDHFASSSCSKTVTSDDQSTLPFLKTTGSVSNLKNLSGADKTLFTKNIIELLLADCNIPSAVVLSPSFKQFAQYVANIASKTGSFDVSEAIGSAKSLRQNLDRRIELEKSTIIKTLKTQAAWPIHLCLDHWKSKRGVYFTGVSVTYLLESDTGEAKLETALIAIRKYSAKTKEAYFLR